MTCCKGGWRNVICYYLVAYNLLTMNKKQTAVNFLVNYMLENFHLTDESLEVFEQAKQIEKAQIIQSWHNGYENQSPMIDEDNCGQTYYTQTYCNPCTPQS